MLDELKSEIDHSHQTMVSKARAMLLSDEEKMLQDDRSAINQNNDAAAASEVMRPEDTEEAEEFKREIEAITHQPSSQ